MIQQANEGQIKEDVTENVKNKHGSVIVIAPIWQNYFSLSSLQIMKS